MENAKYYKFSIYNLKRKNKKVYQTKTKDNKLIFKKFSSLEVGKFKWEVAPIFNEKGENPPASGAKFEILYKSSLRNLSPEDIEILSPETIYRD